MRQGTFIVFEGIDGSGTSTQARLLHDRLVQMEVRVNLTTEPSNGPVGLLIRQGLTARVQFDPKTLALLFAADRLDHLNNNVNGIVAGLDAGTVEITDRYVLSSLAYQSVECDPEWVKAVNKFAPHPDILLFLDIKPDVSATRIGRRQTTTHLYEDQSFLEKVVANYYELLSKIRDSVHVEVLDGSKAPEELAEEIWSLVAPHLEGLLFVRDRNTRDPQRRRPKATGGG